MSEEIINCLFCNNKDIKERIIYEDDLIIAFPTNTPITPGHTLICPKKHIGRIDELESEEILAIINFIVKLKNGIKKCIGAEGFNIAWNEGKTAGQSVDHLHVHVVPRSKGDAGIYDYEPRKFLYRPGSRSETPKEELQEIAKLIKINLL